MKAGHGKHDLPRIDMIGFKNLFPIRDRGQSLNFDLIWITTNYVIIKREYKENGKTVSALSCL